MRPVASIISINIGGFGMLPLEISTFDDLQNLIQNKIMESNYLEYKSEIGNRDKVTKQVTAFANSNGGFIVYGILEKDHLPIEIKWISGSNKKEQIESMITTTIHPLLSTYTIIPIINPDNIKQAIYVLKINVSFDAPHMASNNKYYIRRKYKSEPMEDSEVRQLIFERGIKHALVSEIKYNFELANRYFSNLEKIQQEFQRKKNPIGYVPLSTEAWKAATISGIFKLNIVNISDLIDLYNIIHEINGLIDYMKSGITELISPIDDSSTIYGKFIPALINSKIQKFYNTHAKLKDLIED